MQSCGLFCLPIYLIETLISSDWVTDHYIIDCWWMLFLISLSAQLNSKIYLTRNWDHRQAFSANWLKSVSLNIRTDIWTSELNNLIKYAIRTCVDGEDKPVIASLLDGEIKHEITPILVWMEKSSQWLLSYSYW